MMHQGVFVAYFEHWALPFVENGFVVQTSPWPVAF
jgi:hypothetical protein